MTEPRRSRRELEARLDDLERFFTQLDECRGLDPEDLEALIMVRSRRAEPKHYERLKSSETGRAALNRLQPRRSWASRLQSPES